MRIAVCDDNIQEQKQMTQAIRACDPAQKPECFARGKELLSAAGSGLPFDIVFLDIYMPGENGVEIARQLLELSPATGIAFVTTSADYAVDAFALNAIHYLVKPVKTEDVEEALRRLEQLRRKKCPVVVLSAEGVSHTVPLDQISYVQSAGHAKEVVLTSGKIIRVWMAMEEMQSRLGPDFLKLNRSALVNMEQIVEMGVDSCLLRDGSRLDFARRERAAIRAAYNDYLFSRLNGRQSMEVGP